MKRMVDDKEIRNFDDRITALEQGGGGGGTYTAGDNISISNNEISTVVNPTFENVIIENDSYSANNFLGYVIEYNESGDNNSGWIKMNSHSPELYNYNDYLHGEYGNSASLEVVEDIIVHKEGYTNYPDGFYDKSYNLIDTLDSYGTRITTLEQSGGGGSQLYRHHVVIDLLSSSSLEPLGSIRVDIINSSNTAIATMDAIKTILASGTGSATQAIVVQGV